MIEISGYVDEILNGLAELGNLSCKNRNWLVEVWIDFMKGKVAHILSIEMPDWDRATILGVNSYIEYINEPMKKHGIKKQGFLKYNFIEKIIDQNNNLIILCSVESIERTEEFGELEE